MKEYFASSNAGMVAAQAVFLCCMNKDKHLESNTFLVQRLAG